MAASDHLFNIKAVKIFARADYLELKILRGKM